MPDQPGTLAQGVIAELELSELVWTSCLRTLLVFVQDKSAELELV